MFDLLLVMVFLIPTLLIFPFVVIIMKIQSPGPIFFKQKRTGLDGKDFYLYKFRSMHVNKDADKLQATKNDPRKYPFGNFMRKANIDEVPQIFNILKGDMSVVGPRPHMLAHTEHETRYYFGAGGFFHEVIKGEKYMDEVFASRLANDLTEAFHRLMNREY